MCSRPRRCPPYAQPFQGSPDCTGSLERTAELRAAANTTAREAVASARYTALLLRLTGVFMREPWLQLVDELLPQQRSQSAFSNSLPACSSGVTRRCSKSGHRLAELDAVGLHALRIEIKKLRYAADFFSALYDKKDVREYLNALADLQELLGGLNDAATVERLLEPLRETEGSGQRLEGVGLLRGWTAASTRAHLDQLPTAWERFRQCGVFWKSKASGKGVKSEG